jgi:hypothetical protein
VLNATIKYTQQTFNSTANKPTLKWKLGADGTLNTISSSNYSIDTTNKEITISNLTLSNVLPYTQQGRLYLVVNDLLTSDSEYYVVAVGIPVYDYGEFDFQVNGDLYIADRNRQNPVNVGEKLNNLVVDSLDNEATDQAPSVRAVNEKMNSFIESKSNTNGYYTKFSDGTLICCGKITIPKINQNSSAGVTATFPHAFVDTNYFVSTSFDGNVAYWTWIVATINTKSTSSTQFGFWNNSSSGANAIFALDYIAIGRWK